MEKKFKHLEFIQSVINRMTNNSFLLKGWCLSIIGAIFALRGGNSSTSILPLFVIMFWLLDSYYLSQERLFIALYNDVVPRSEDKIDFLMHTKKFCRGRNTWWRSFFSHTPVIFYGFILIVIIFINSNSI